MKRIKLDTHSAAKDAAIRCYLIAETLLVSDLQTSHLEPFAADEGGQWQDGHAAEGSLLEADGTITYSGPGWVGNRWRDVVCRRISSGYRIAVEGIGAFTVASDGQRVIQVESSDACTGVMLVEAALGPPLILALALQGKFCLHAGLPSVAAS